MSETKNPVNQAVPKSTRCRAQATQVLLLLCTFGALIAGNALGALIAYDPMAYTGSQINTGTAAPTGTPTQTSGGGWTGNWGGGALTLNNFGMAYANLPTKSLSISTLGANILYNHIASAPSSGSVWVSVLFKQAGDIGGNRAGVILESSSGAGVLLAYQQNSASQGKPCLMAMTGTSTVGAQIGTSANFQTYANTNLYVLEFVYTSGTVSTVRVYSNPVAGQTTVPAPDFSVSTGLPSIGALVNFGLINPVGAANITLDEFRVADSFADVVGVSALPLTASIASPTNGQTVSIYGYTITANATVLPGSVTNVDFYVDGLLSTNATVSPFKATISGSSAGSHALHVVAMDNNGNSATSSVVNVTAANLKPSATVTNPVSGSQILAASNVSLIAAAADDNAVTNVDFYVDGVFTGSAQNSPYTVSWIAAPGAHSITAVASDNDGLSSTSAVVNVTGTLPSVTIVSPANGQTVSIHQYTVTASPTVNPGTITNVDFYVDSVLASNRTTSPYTIQVSGSLPGAHALQVVAMDSNGNSATSSVVNVTAANLAPSIAVTNPAAGSQILVGTSVTIRASAADDSAVTNVDFYVDGLLVGSATGIPYSAVWVASAGAHALSAVAYDNEGLGTTSAVVNVTGTLPAVSITSPTNGQLVSIYNYTVNASATVTPGTITNVGLYVDAVLVSNKTAAPFVFTVSGSSPGIHSLQAIATDSNGNTANSALVSVTATNLAPSVTITNPATGSQVLVSSSVTIGASASDDNAVTNVDFYVDGGYLGSATSAPYSAVWATGSAGAHTLTAVAYDTDGLSTTSAPVSVIRLLNYNAYEPFNYASLTNGSPSTAAGFAGNWTCGTTPAIVAGMTYTGLPVANSALSSTSGRQFVNFAGPLSNGTEYVSFLFTQTANNGGNKCGVYFPNGGTGLFFGYGFAPGATTGALGLGTMNTAGTTVQGTLSTLGSSFTGTYGTTYFVVIKIDFNTSAANDTVTVYINPNANSPTPGVSATYTVNSVDVGTITGIGLNNQGGGQAIKIDEIRRATTYGEVVGYNPPAVPSGLVATPGVNSVSLSWSNATGATGYKLLRGTSSGNYTVTNLLASPGYVDLTAAGGTTYYYAVQATNASGASALSVEASATPTIALPNVPTGLAATGSNAVVNLTWNVASGATGYNVKRSTTTGTETTIASVAGTSYQDLAVVNGQQYFYTVSATNSAGESADSAETTATPDAPPAAPVTLSAVAGTNQVNLAWTGSSGATSYHVKRSLLSGTGYVTIATTTAPVTNYTDVTAVKFTQYFYTVSAANANGESPDSIEASATVLGSYGPVAYEPFAYPLGSLTNGTVTTGTGFSGAWTISGGGTIDAGLSYSNLTVAANALSSSGATHQYEMLSNPMGSGSVWVSVLFQQTGDNGGNRDGFVLADASGNGVEFAYQQFGASQGLPALMTINGYYNYTGQLSPISSTPQTYNTANLYVFELRYNGAGSLTNIAVYSNPAADSNIAPAPDFSVSAGLSGIGALSVLGVAHQAGINITVDEWKVGQVFGDVVGYVPVTAPPLLTSTFAGNVLTLSWPSNYQGWILQSQTNSLASGLSTNWTDVSGTGTTNQAVVPVEQANPSVFYRLRSP